MEEDVHLNQYNNAERTEEECGRLNSLLLVTYGRSLQWVTHSSSPSNSLFVWLHVSSSVSNTFNTQLVLMPFIVCPGSKSSNSRFNVRHVLSWDCSGLAGQRGSREVVEWQWKWQRGRWCWGVNASARDCGRVGYQFPLDDSWRRRVAARAKASAGGEATTTGTLSSSEGTHCTGHNFTVLNHCSLVDNQCNCNAIPLLIPVH